MSTSIMHENNNSFSNSRRNRQFLSEKMGSHAKAWLVEDETAREMLQRVLSDRPFLLLPPLHRVLLRVGNVVELLGPSSSSKTHILIQAAITCILPKEWNGVIYGGLGQSAMFIDLDCRFDILRFSELLNHRIMEAGSSCNVDCKKMDSGAQFARMKHYNEELFALCMKRFLYIRCYDSSEFLATLKTLHYRLQKERDTHGLNVNLLLIDRFGFEPSNSILYAGYLLFSLNRFILLI
ncbi:DNA repair protein XRCC2 homolog [Hibiscus syriacus]|uniref:DNA repair protein XRCC2 homolog n=1 Tax=Hibiscus syriacus TaxID=106335 RepID=UPI00192152DF|nr:DNA repair protein XRCC2 homolog [Hibiscus syriacus]